MATADNQSWWRETIRVWLQYASIGIGAAWAAGLYILLSAVFDTSVSTAFLGVFIFCPVAAFLAWKAFAKGRFVWAFLAPLEIFHLLAVAYGWIITQHCPVPPSRSFFR